MPTTFSPLQTLSLFTLGLCILVAIGGCDSSETGDADVEVRTEQNDGGAETGDLASQVEEYQIAMRQQVAQLNRQIELLDERAEDLGEDSREAYDEAIQAVKEQRNELELALVELEVSTRAAWQEIRVGLDGSWEDLQDSLAAAGRQFGIGGPDPQDPGIPESPRN